MGGVFWEGECNSTPKRIEGLEAARAPGCAVVAFETGTGGVALDQSGEVDGAGRISKCGNRVTRSLLFEAAHILLTRINQPSRLQQWGRRLSKRIGPRKAKVALARRLAVILHRMWIDGTEFDPDPVAAT